jgi:hypothetical protein
MAINWNEAFNRLRRNFGGLKLPTTLGIVQVWLDKQTSDNCKSSLWFGLDK